MLICSLVLVGCGNKYEKQLHGTWYLEGRERPEFTFYDDGTCEIDGEYGTGHWAVVNNNQLKISTFYGEAVVVTIDSIKSGCLTVSNENGNTLIFWNSPHQK